MIDYAKAFSFLTEDERWLEKLGIGTVVLVISLILSPVLIGLIGFMIAIGYAVRVLQNVRDGHLRPLPEWDQWSEDLIRGFKLLVVWFVWQLPALLFSIPVGIGNAIAGSNQEGAAAFFGGMIALCGGCLVLIYGLVTVVAGPGFTIAYARDEQIRSGLQFSTILNWVRENLSQVAIVAIIYLIGSVVFALIGGIAGTLLCLIGLLVTIPLSTLVTYLFQAHLYGQLARLVPLPGGGPTTYSGDDFSNPLPSAINPPTVVE
jgi:hypothetical protein